MKPTGCVRCGAAASYVLHPLELVACETCNHDWLNEETCSVESVEKVVGKFNPVATTAGNQNARYEAHSKRFDAELLKRTLEWAKKARAA